MKRALLIGLSLLSAALLSGCPIYPEERLFCETNLDCPAGYACDGDTGYCRVVGGTGGATGKTCDAPKDCGFNQTCSSKGVCKTGDCSFHGCVTGYTCVVDQGTWACVSGTGGTGGSAGPDGGDGSAGTDGGDGSAGDDGGSDATTDAAADASDAAGD